jgi:hypothetical protein
MAALVILLLLLVLGAASLLGRTDDSRDDEFTLGRVFAGRFRTGP